MRACDNCQKLTSNPRFCSRSCSAIRTNSEVIKRVKSFVYCLNCNISVYGGRYKCCSIACRKQYRFKTETLPKFKAGLNTDPEASKRCLTHLCGYKCVLCGNLGWHNNKPLVLQLDHIDGNSDNNLPENLRLLCPSCHTQTDTFATRQKKDTKRNRYLRKVKGYVDAL